MRPLECGEQRTRVLRGEQAHADHRLALDRVRLLRHGGRRAAMMAALLVQLPDLGTGELDDLTREPAAQPRERGEREPGFGDAVARGVPRHVDRAQAEPACDRVPHLATSRPERGGRAGGAEELHDCELCARGPEPLEVTGKLREPDGHLAAKGDRDGGLGVCAARHHGPAVLLRQRREPVAERAHDAFDAVESSAADEREACVHDVLRRRAAVQVATCNRGSTHDLVEQRQDRIADDERLLAQCGEVDVLGHCGGRDLARGLGRDYAELGLRLGERALDLEPRCDERLLREEPDHLLIAEDVDQRREHRPTILGARS